MKAKVLAFTADPDTVVEGEATTLRWSTEDATAVFLLEDGVKLHPGRLPSEGSLEVAPTRDTRYRLEVRGEDGRFVESQLEVKVEAFGAPRIELFTASPNVTGRGNPVSLRWIVERADVVEIGVAGGGTLAEFSPAAREEAYEVRPTEKTTYVLRARNAAGMATEEVEVSVSRRPSLDLQLSASEVAFGEEVVLRWTVEEAETLAIIGPDGVVLHEGAAEDGELALVAEVPGAYRATAIGVGGEVNEIVHLSIRPEIERFEVSVQGSARPGAMALVSWAVRGAERIVVSNGFEDLLESSRGAHAVSLELATGGSFTLRAYSGSQMTSEFATVRVIEEPLIRRISTGPLVTAGQGVAGVSTIGWEIDGASKILVEVDPGGVVDVTDKSPRLDEVEIVFTDAGTVTLIAFNDAGSSRMTIEAPVDPVPIFDRFFAAPSRAGSGDTVDLHWDVLFAERVVLEREGAELLGAPTDPAGMHTTENLAAPTTYRLRAYNSLGHEAFSEPLLVEIGAPNQLRFDTADGLRFYRVEDEVELVWENDGGKELSILWGDTVVHATTDAAEIRQGSHLFTMPDTQQDVPLLLEVENSSGTDSRLLELRAVTGPLVLDFTTDVPEITDGDSVEFFWETQRDTKGNIPTLTLEDDRGVAYDMSDIAGADALAGSKRFTVEGWDDQPRVFTLTASSDVPPAFSFTTELIVYGVPEVDAISASPPFAAAEGDRVTLAWETTHGVSLDLFYITEGGEAEATPFHSIVGDPATVENGSYNEVEPSIAHPHVRMIVRNPLGAETVAELRVGVDPATVTSFTANGMEAPTAIDVLFGEEVTLAWALDRADDAVLREAFIDISQRPGAESLGVMGTSTTKRTVLDFPEGFTFPYDGHVFDTVAISNTGYLTFDTSALITGADQVLPNTTGTGSYRGVDIAAFWDSIRNSEIWWEHVEGAVDRLIIQWTGAEFTSSSFNPADLTFQVVLFEDGRFEIRHGPMIGSHANARAGSATIGAQSHDCSYGCAFGEQLVRQTEQPNGLEGRVYRFDGLHDFLEEGSTPVPVPEEGSITFRPADSRTYTLRAWNDHSEHEVELEVNVHQPASVRVWTSPEMPGPGVPVELRWEGSGLTSLEIEDASGAVIHTASASELAFGSFPLGSLATGVYSYTFRGVGEVPYDLVDVPFDVSVNTPFSLDDFTASAERIDAGEPVLLSWASTDATSVKIEAVPGGLLPGTTTPDGGSISHEPEQTTTYVLTVESHGRELTAERTVEVRQAWLEDLEFSRTEVQRGDTIDISWTLQNPNGEAVVTIEPELKQYIMEERPGNFSSIASTGTLQSRSGSVSTGHYHIVFPADFSFPYFGREFTEAKAMVQGYFNFAFTQSSGSSTDFIMPRPHATYPSGLMALYWMNLNVGSTGEVYTQYVTDPSDPANDHLIIEWSHFDYTTSSHKPGDVNFQLVLFRSGAFEYRYGDITSANDAVAQGSSSGAGFQDSTGRYGYHIWFNQEIGPANRTWRYEPPSGGSRTLQPEHSGPYRICVETSAWRECEERFITVFEPGDILISELMVEPNLGGHPWFEVRNIAPGPFDLEGKTIRMGGETHTINSGGALIVPPGGYAVLAQANDPDVMADYVYGTSLEMEAPAGSVAIEWDGMVMGETSWSSSWAFTSGASLELHNLHHKAFQPSRSSFSEYCESAVPLGASSFGTPGRHEGACAESEGYEVDFASPNAYIDIRETGVRVYDVQSTVNTAYEIPGGIGFTIPFFSDLASDLWVSSEGLVGLSGSPSTSSTNRALGTGSGTASGQGLIVPFWDTLSINPGSAFHWERRTIAGSEVMILQWTDFRYNTTTPPGTMSFQVQIWDNGDIAILLGDTYRTVKYSTHQNYHGHLGTVGGIESMTGNEAILYQHNDGIARGHQSFYFKKL